MSAAAHHKEAGRERPSLYVVGTPIGNLSDMTLRALHVLKAVDAIAAEDTRMTARLLGHYGIATPVFSLHQHNERKAAQHLVGLLEQGKSVALVSDAGTPGISDPGAIAVAVVRAAGFTVIPIPGANAAVCALSAAGMSETRFLFCGFLPQKASARRQELEMLRAVRYALVFYEAPHRVLATIADLAAVLGAERNITIAKELTKLFESIHACTLGEAGAWLAADPDRIKGEFVLLVGGAPDVDAASDEYLRVLEILLREMPLKQAVSVAVKLTGGNRNELYRLALAAQKDTA